LFWFQVGIFITCQANEIGRPTRARPPKNRVFQACPPIGNEKAGWICPGIRPGLSGLGSPSCPANPVKIGPELTLAANYWSIGHGLL